MQKVLYFSQSKLYIVDVTCCINKLLKNDLKINITSVITQLVTSNTVLTVTVVQSVVVLGLAIWGGKLLSWGGNLFYTKML